MLQQNLTWSSELMYELQVKCQALICEGMALMAAVQFYGCVENEGKNSSFA